MRTRYLDMNETENYYSALCWRVLPDNYRSEKTSKNSKWNKIQDWKYGKEIKTSRSGEPSRINFAIGETEIPNIFQQEQKFLGRLLSPTGNLNNAFDYIKSEFESKLISINALLIQDEYKVWIYKHYFLLFDFCSLFKAI